MNPTRSRTIIFIFTSLALGALMGSPALGALSASPNPSSTGSYTVSDASPPTLPADESNAFYDRSYYYNLVETPPSGSAKSYDQGRGPVSQSFTGKAVGTYAYQLQTCVYTYQETEPEPTETTVCTNRGSSLSVSVVSPPPADPMPTFGMSSVSARSWKQNSAITAFTVPAATGGDTPLTYSASGLPAGVSMNASRSVSGTPTAAGMGTATVTVSDNDSDTDTLSFTWAVAADLMQTFGMSSVSAKSWKQNSAIAAFTVPAATGGDGTLSYSVSGLPAGLSMSSSREVSGTPTAHGTGTATVTATDSDGDTDTLSFTWAVAEDLTPDFGTASVSYRSWVQNSAITAFTVPEASGGDTPLSYSISGLPAGLSMSSSRQVSGTPTASGVGAATVTVTDADGDTDTLRFSWSVGADLTPTFGTATIADKTFKQNSSITAFYVPLASSGNLPLSYSASGLPAGVSLASNRRVSGTPTGHGTGTATVTVTDSDGDTDTLDFDWTVNEDLVPSFGTASVADKDWTLRARITAFTVPAATGGDGTLRYSVSGLASGVWMSTSTRRVSGRPLGTDASSGTATVTVRDTDGDTDTLSFDWSVADPMPDFDTASVSDKTWTQNTAIARFTVPAASGGNSPLRYSASGLPAGVTMSSLRRVSGTPTATGSGTATVTVTDYDGDTDTLSFDWTVAAEPTDEMPTFGTSSVSAKSWKQNSAITAFTVPAATGGDAPLSYSASGLPAGVSMNASRSVSGTPSTAGMGTATVTVSDNDGDTATLSFAWTVAADLMPAFGMSSVSAKSWTQNSAITAFTVPAATGGDGTLSYSATGLPAGVSMSTSRQVSGTPTASGSGTAIVTATDDDGDTDSVSFGWTVLTTPTDEIPSFNTVSVPAKSWTQHHAITAFTVPTASSGDAPLSYGATGLPAGVSMSTARQVSGAPTATGSGTATVTVTDRDGDTDTLTFDWTVSAPLPGQLKALPNPSTDGNYSVSQTAPPALPADVLTTDLQTTNYYNLVETPPIGDERSYDLGRGPVSQALTGKSTGTYRYRLQTCVFTLQRTEFDFTETTVCADVGASLSVTVTPPPTPSVITGPSNSINGTYTLNWGASTGATRYELQERKNGGRWSSVSRTNSSATTHAFTGKRNAIYDYRVNACKMSACSAWTAVKTITVSIPPTAGFDESYIIRAGDLGSDGDTDIYLSPLAIGSGNVGEFILRNDSGTLVLDAMPSTVDLAAAQGWTKSTTLKILVEDIDLDGVADAYVKGITGSITDAVDQFVISSTTSGAVPESIIAVDSELQSFFNAVLPWYKDLSHYDEMIEVNTRVIHGATDVPGSYATHLQHCIAKWVRCETYDGTLTSYYGGLAECIVALASRGFDSTDDGQPVSRARACTFTWRVFFGVVQQAFTDTDFTGLPAEAADFMAIWKEGSDSYDVEDLADVLESESVLGITIGGFDFSGIENDDLDDPDEQRIYEVHQALLNIWALFEEREDRAPDVVYVTRRRVGGLGWLPFNFNWHAALEYAYTTFNGHYPTIAAYNEYEEDDLVEGTLVMRRNQPSEYNNIVTATVTSPLYATGSLLWPVLVNLASKYCQNLEYAYPGYVEDHEFNSNGFAAGIINSVPATTNAPIHTYYLGSRPVPSNEFRRTSCP